MNSAFRSLLMSGIAILILFQTRAMAQPSDAQVLKDISWPGVVKKELRPGTIKKVWSNANDQYYWDRACVVWRNAGIPEYPNAMLEVGGFARYSYVTNTYQDFLTTYNTYTGIPAPNNDEIMAMMKGNLKGVLGEYKFNNIVGQLHYLRFPENSGPTWDSPTHLTVPVEVAYERKEGPTWTTVYSDRLRVHFYRETINSPWKDEVMNEELESTHGQRKEYAEWELKKMPTLGSLAAEQQAQAAVDALPAVSVPAFKTDREAMQYTVDILRTADEGRIRAYLMQVLAPGWFVEGSTTQLIPQAKGWMESIIQVCCKSRMNWGEQYCVRPAEKEYHNGEFSLWNKVKDKASRFVWVQGGTTWKNGQQVGGSPKLSAIEVYIHTNENDIARLRSYEPGYLCKEEGGEGKEATGGATSGGAQQQSTGGSLLNKGKGLLNKLTTP
ncbi:MAG: hypothetical protein IT228_11965 [Flavobacteriales bacterium]|nr:hypothetical protein [Flavobacteriales bacterium]MCC6578050.1 hypothetical protein [Flavobacteriales bacterium]NUQ16194.1 hypothetical protein [Flavobacteriales bacterium]